jgi:hypothetical protein
VLIDRRASFSHLLLLPPLDIKMVDQVKLARSSMTKLISVCRHIEAEAESERAKPARSINSAEMACSEIEQRPM